MTLEDSARTANPDGTVDGTLTAIPRTEPSGYYTNKWWMVDLRRAILFRAASIYVYNMESACKCFQCVKFKVIVPSMHLMVLSPSNSNSQYSVEILFLGFL